MCWKAIKDFFEEIKEIIHQIEVRIDFMDIKCAYCRRVSRTFKEKPILCRCGRKLSSNKDVIWAMEALPYDEYLRLKATR